MKRVKKLPLFLLALVFWSVIIFLAMWFIELNPNPSQWPIDMRIVMVTAVLILSCMSTLD